ncbi:NmrA domain-containing protein [Favolaschia claudopus]|uniref:NmrA domain-containing protein n=1 Tax=Favolaschia claudopus TaxID=2862362 RepID=A0AAW0DX69_9AGAR
MTITQDPSAPLVAVVGATGAQGGAVVYGLEESDKAYRVRGFTRDGTKPVAQELAKRGVEIITVSLVVENKEAVFGAFAGADFTFLVTNYFEHGDKQREINEGKLLIDASEAAGASRIIWSGLRSYDKLSGGRYPNAHQFESKAIVTEYARQCGVPFVDLQAGFYGTNLLGSIPFFYSKQEDGNFALAWPTEPTVRVPYIDIARDYGLWARYMLELPTAEFPNGASMMTHSEILTVAEMAAQISQVTGKNVVFRRLEMEPFIKNVEASGFPAEPMVDVWKAIDEFGWPTTTSCSVLPRPTRTWKEFVEISDWSKVFGSQ